MRDWLTFELRVAKSTFQATAAFMRRHMALESLIVAIGAMVTGFREYSLEHDWYSATETALFVGFGTIFAIFVCVLISAAIASPYRMWVDLIRKIEAFRNQPKFKLEILQTGQGQSRPAPGQAMPKLDGSFLSFVILRVTNLGDHPSALLNWSISAQKPNGDKRYATMEQFRSATIPGAYTFTSDQTIYEKTSRPVQPGAIEIGHILFSLPDEYRIDQKGITLSFSCEDVFGIRYEAEQETTGVPGQAQYFPGMEKQAWYHGSQNDL
jgi:hypothetical protein